ncbi:MAG: endonuclease/exonuclease/phosphatase family protein [Bacteroidia bacterium]|nr:endonuclease/exonuclease/phosphatase family protein [Bacteroidia bacterium]
MKKLTFFNKMMYFFNTIFAVVLLFSFILPYVKPESFSLLSLLSLAVPILIIINVFFFLYWLLKLKKQLILSFMVLFLGYILLPSLYKFSSSNDKTNENSFSIMNYNVRLFNVYNWIEKPDIEKDIFNIISENQPDILCLQEFRQQSNLDWSAYKHKYERLFGRSSKYGQVIYSRYPIINSGSIEFPDSSNNAIYADIVVNTDTLRVYNLHLQSFYIDTTVDNFDTKQSEAMLKRLQETFTKQQAQTELFLPHVEQSPYKVIIAGDFNNSAYSYVYNQIRGDLKDTFEEAGNGFGRTYKFKYFPLRIDFILVDNSFEVNSFKTLNEELSDHFPIYTEISLHK